MIVLPPLIRCHTFRMTDIQDLSRRHSEGHISLSEFPEFCTLIPQPYLILDMHRFSLTIQWAAATKTIHTGQVWESCM